MGSSHAHGPSSETATSIVVRGRLALAVAVVALVIGTLGGMAALWSDRANIANAPDAGQRVDARALSSVEVPCSQSLPGLEVPPGGEDEFAEADEGLTCSETAVRILDGPSSSSAPCLHAAVRHPHDIRSGPW